MDEFKPDTPAVSRGTAQHDSMPLIALVSLMAWAWRYGAC
jgi:hypothetical protein